MTRAILALLLGLVPQPPCRVQYGARAPRVCPVTVAELRAHAVKQHRQYPRVFMDPKLARRDAWDARFGVRE